jgi:hypothetical protein
MPSASDGVEGTTSTDDGVSDMLSNLRQRLEARRAVLASGNAASSRAAGRNEQHIEEGDETEKLTGENLHNHAIIRCIPASQLLHSIKITMLSRTDMGSGAATAAALVLGTYSPTADGLSSPYSGFISCNAHR